LQSKRRVGPALGVTLVRLNQWVASIQSGGTDRTADRIAAMSDLGRTSDLVEKIADALVGNAVGVDRRFLSKSLQEALYYCIEFETNIDYAELKSRFIRYIDRTGAAWFLRRFASLYFFHLIWFETGQSFRALSRNPDGFDKYAQDVESICHRTVGSIWRAFQKTKRPFDAAAASELVLNIEKQLRGE
jgi:hypothetical protein